MVNKKVCSILTLSYGSSEAHSDKQKADVLNSFFSTCWNQSVPPLASSDKIILSDIWLPSEHYCTEEEILVLLRNLDCTKSTGPDGISARMLKETALSISGPLTNLLNFLIRQHHFPLILPIMSKIFEKHIYSVLMNHLEDNYPISHRQWGYQLQAGKSTTTALAATTLIWYGQLDAGRDVATVFFDFSI